MHMRHRRMGWIGALTLIGVGLAMGTAQEQATKEASSRRVFVRGGSESVATLPTSWRDRDVRWSVTSEAGELAKGWAHTDANGAVSLRFAVPKVRVASHLALGMVAGNDPAAATEVIDVVALPADPFDSVRQTLAKLDVGVLPSKPLTAAIRRSRLKVVELRHDIARGAFAGKVVILGTLLGDDLDATKTYLGKLPAGTCVILVNDGNNSPLAGATGFLTADKPPGKTRLHLDAKSLLWADMPCQWLGDVVPSRKMGEPVGLLGLRVLAGFITPGEQVFPLALEAQDTAGRWWLTWNLTWEAQSDDPRWDLLLRNSLLWAAQKTDVLKN